MTWRRVIVAVIGVLAAFAVLGFGLELAGYTPPTDPPPAHVLSGTFTLVDDATAGNGCIGPDGGNWHEVRPGAEVSVRSDGQWLGSGHLGDGRQTTWGQFGEAACDYDFSVGLPTAEAYSVEYPGGLTVDYTYEELQSYGWQVGPTCCTFVPAR